MPTAEDPSQDGPNDLLMRPGGLDDAETVARMYGSVRSATVPLVPPAIHAAGEDLRHFTALLGDGEHECWVVEAGGEPAGFAILTPTWLDHLYVAEHFQRQGIGSALLELVKGLRPDGFGLWVFETNTPARAFYARHGLVEEERTDGSDNEERAPDIRMVWSGRRS